MKQLNVKKQVGATLLMAIIFLLLITIVGVSSVSSTLIKTQVAGNSIFSMLVYQGAESTLAKSVSNKEKATLNLTAQTELHQILFFRR